MGIGQSTGTVSVLFCTRPILLMIHIYGLISISSICSKANILTKDNAGLEVLLIMCFIFVTAISQCRYQHTIMLLSIWKMNRIASSMISNNKKLDMKLIRRFSWIIFEYMRYGRFYYLELGFS